MDRLVILKSFLEGFRRDNPPDVINALFITKNLTKQEIPFEFQNRDNNGVDSPEIRRLLVFNGKELEKQEAIQEEFEDFGKKLAELAPNELKWAAQFLKNGETHLFPEEVKMAKESLKKVTSSAT